MALGSVREIALKLSEIMRLPSIGVSAAELQHGQRAALSPRTPVIMIRLRDETAATVDALRKNFVRKTLRCISSAARLGHSRGLPTTIPLPTRSPCWFRRIE